jgi:hypothetical protein
MAKRSSKKGGCGNWAGGKRKRTMRGGMVGLGDPETAGLGVGNMPRVWVAGNAPAPGGPHGASEFTDPTRGNNASGGGRRRGSRRTRRVIKKKSVATIKRLLKAKGLKVSGSRRAVTVRARKARIPLKGGTRVGTTGASFVGTGSAGLASQTAYDTNTLPEGGGVMRLPGLNDGGFYENQAGGMTRA